MKEFLEIGDKIQGYDINGNKIGSLHTVISTTKTLAKTDIGNSFKINISYVTIKPNSECLGEVKINNKYPRRYFYIG